MQSVELLFDPAGAERVVGQWDALAAAGLPSQARHRGDTNAPHITIGLADAVDEDAESALGDLLDQLPLPVHLGPIALFEGRNSVVLARMVLASAELLALHAEVSLALRRCPGQVEHLAVGHWVPHVTLARRMKPESVAEALAVLRQHQIHLSRASAVWGSDSPAREAFAAHATELRRWDSEAKQAWIVPGATSS